MAAGLDCECLEPGIQNPKVDLGADEGGASFGKGTSACINSCFNRESSSVVTGVREVRPDGVRSGWVASVFPVFMACRPAKPVVDF